MTSSPNSLGSVGRCDAQHRDRSFFIMMMSFSSSSFGNNRHCVSVDLHAYLRLVEDVLRFRGTVTTVPIPSGQGKTMIKTLLGVDDSILLKKRNCLHHRKLSHFFTTQLSPLIDDDTILKEKLPHYETALSKALEWNPADSHHTLRFKRVASGKDYQGNPSRLLQDGIGDPALQALYDEAVREPTDLEVLSVMVEELSFQQQRSDLPNKRDEAARKCLERMRNEGEDGTTAGTEQVSSTSSKAGSETEALCFQYVQQQQHCHEDESIMVLQNVLVKQNTKKTNGKIKKEEDQWQKDPNGGILLTSSSGQGEGVCSEWDVLVVKKVQDNEEEAEGTKSLQPVEIWESKATLNPTTIHDVLTKKMPSYCSVLSAGDNELLCRKGRFLLLPKTGHSWSLGIFGGNLQEPAIAANRLASIVGQELLGRDETTVLRALETNEITVNVERVIDKLEHLKSACRNAEDDHQVKTVVLTSTET
jgi:hypothetical protein